MLVTEFLLSVITLITSTHFFHHLHLKSQCCNNFCLDLDIDNSEHSTDKSGIFYDEIK